MLEIGKALILWIHSGEGLNQLLLIIKDGNPCRDIHIYVWMLSCW